MHFVSGIQSGGVEQMLINYTGFMNENYNINQIIVYQHEPNKICLKKFLDAKDKCIRISDKRKNPIKNIVDTLRIIKEEKPDVIHAHMNLLNFIPLFCGFLCGVKVRISHSHIANNNINSSIAEKTFKILNLLFANALLACGQKAGKYMYGNRKFKAIYNSVDIDRFKFDRNKRETMRKALNIGKDEMLLGNVGRLTTQKNQIFLLEMMKKIVSFNKKIKLIILGNGELKINLNDMLKKYHLDDNVLIHEPVNNIEEYYDAMDTFLLPSLYEGFPVSLVEAQVSGLKSLVSNTIDTTAKINDTVKFLDNSDVDVWIKHILNKSIKNREIDIENFKDFDINNSYEKLYSIYKRLLDSKIKRR